MRSPAFSASPREFPRLQKRGPIEASNFSTFTARPEAGFHAYKSVAPLKHALRHVVRRDDPGFHAYKSVAPLKLERLRARGEHRCAFPRLQKRGPIEALGSAIAEVDWH